MLVGNAREDADLKVEAARLLPKILLYGTSRLSPGPGPSGVPILIDQAPHA